MKKTLTSFEALAETALAKMPESQAKKLQVKIDKTAFCFEIYYISCFCKAVEKFEQLLVLDVDAPFGLIEQVIHFRKYLSNINFIGPYISFVMSSQEMAIAIKSLNIYLETCPAVEKRCVQKLLNFFEKGEPL
jgi:hypothetical protein